MNKKQKTNAYDLLSPGWVDVAEVPGYLSFRCLIKFRQVGMEGPSINHVSTGYWLHNYKCFIVDNEEMRDMTPDQFIPLHDDIYC